MPDTNTYPFVCECADWLKARVEVSPDVLLILGSGLGGLADKLGDPLAFNYADIPHFPRSTAPGHAGRLIFGRLGGKNVVCMQGRFHYYEGWQLDDVVFPVRVAATLGIRALLATNAAGGVNIDFKPGDLMAITDHIKFFGDNPLRGENIEAFGPRFPDMSSAYDRDFLECARRSAEKCDVNLREGVYFMTTGPCYETPAEIRAIRALGGDAVGMSTVPEVITARHAGMRVLGISCITNMAAGILDKPLAHAEVLETGERVKASFSALIEKTLELLQL